MSLKNIIILVSLARLSQGRESLETVAEFHDNHINLCSTYKSVKFKRKESLCHVVFSLMHAYFVPALYSLLSTNKCCMLHVCTGTDDDPEICSCLEASGKSKVAICLRLYVI